jgi:hypothetical protein
MSGQRPETRAHLLALQPAEGMPDAIQPALGHDEAERGANDQLHHCHDRYRMRADLPGKHSAVQFTHQP